MPRRAGFERFGQYLFGGVDEHQLQLLTQLDRHVLHVSLVRVRQHDRLDTRAVSGQNLFLDAADRLVEVQLIWRQAVGGELLGAR